MTLSKIARRTTAKAKSNRSFNLCFSTVSKSLVLLGLLFFFALAAGSAHAQITLPAIGYINTVAGDGSAGYSPAGDGILATNAELHSPTGVVVDNAGNIYIADPNNNRIRKVNASTGIISTFASNGGIGFSGDGGLATNAETNYPRGVALDTAGNLYIADTNNHRVRVVNTGTSAITIATVVIQPGYIQTVAGNGSAGYSPAGDGILATKAELHSPTGVAVDKAGNIYIADQGNNRIRKVNASTGIISTFASNGGVGFNGDGGLATSAETNMPYGVVLDNAGNLYIADTNNNRVRVVNTGTIAITIATVVIQPGDLQTVAGNGSAGYDPAGDGILATKAELHSPTGVAVDLAGDIYIADPNNNRIRMVNGSTGIITTFASNGGVGFSGDGGLATNAETNYPYGVALDSVGHLYIADTNNNRIRAVGVPPFTTAILDPAYQVTSIIYTPPGNKSQDGFINTTTNGSTTTIGSSFQDAQTMSFSYGWGWGSVGGSLGMTWSTSNSTAFQETFSNSLGIANMSISTNPDVINHNQDLFLIWLDPQATVVMNGSTPVTYSMGIQPTANGATPAPDIVEITAITMEANAAGVSTVPPVWLNQQYNTATKQYTPGLAAICKNLKTAEYAAGTCTLADQCGCTPADFAPILATDPLLYYNGATNPISPYPATASPLEANTSTDCGTLPIPSGANCRYVPVPSEPGSTVQESVTLTGPDCAGCANSPNTFNQTENTQTTQTYGTSTGVSVGVTVKINSGQTGGLGPSLTIDNKMTWTDSQSTGTASGSGATLNVSLNSSTVDCGQDIPVYEDTEFHTFVFQQPAGNTSCTTAMAKPTFSPVANTYATAQTVTISDATPGVAIYYTTSGTTPTTSSTLYTGPITVSMTETVNAIAVFSGYVNSPIGSAVYTIQ